MEYKGIAMTIAGSDSGGGAGIQADLKTFQAFDVFGVSAVTSITAQNTTGVRSVQDIDTEIIADQIDMIMEDMGCGAAKTGMLSNKSIIETVAEKIQQYKIDKLVVDPVMVAESGDRLLQEKAEKTLIEKLLPFAYLITPNVYEAEIIADMKISSLEDAKQACKKIYKMGTKNILLKGGHLKQNKAVDLLYNGSNFEILEKEKIDSRKLKSLFCFRVRCRSLLSMGSSYS